MKNFLNEPIIIKKFNLLLSEKEIEEFYKIKPKNICFLRKGNNYDK